MNRSKASPKKEEQDRLQAILLDLLKEVENKCCADCNARTPRWASWNLGVFICIRCAGFHRNLGVHISKVRSVSLDSWTAEQVQSMRVMGNQRASETYEHNLPEYFSRDMTDRDLREFIRAKYEHKRYMLKDFIYPQVDASELTKSTIRSPVSESNYPAPVSNFDLLVFTPPAYVKAEETSPNSVESHFDDFTGISLGESIPAVQNETANNFDDTFGSFVSASSYTNGVRDVPVSTESNVLSPTSTAAVHCHSSATKPASQGQTCSTADILSLYGHSTARLAPTFTSTGFADFGTYIPAQMATYPGYSISSRTNISPDTSLNGFNSISDVSSARIPSFPSYLATKMDADFADLSFGKATSTRDMTSSPNPTEQKPFSIADGRVTPTMNCDDLIMF